MAFDPDVWSKLLASRETRSTPPNLRAALRYLREARNSGEGWGVLRGLPTELHQSAVAIEALEVADDDGRWLVEDAALYLRRGVGKDADNLSLEQLSDLLIAVHTQAEADEAYREDLLSRLERLYNDLLDRPHHLTTGMLCSGLLAVERFGGEYLARFENPVKALLELQSEDGSWPAVTGEIGALVPTALSVRVLRQVGTTRAPEACRRGQRYLQDSVRTHGWESLGRGGDTYSVATVLRAIAEDGRADYELVNAGVETLQHKVNSDGGWGGSSEEPSTVEATALSILALVGAGATRMVPARLAQTAMQALQEDLRATDAERDRLRTGMEKEVERQCRKVMQDRDKLRRENEQLKEQARSVERLDRILASQRALSDLSPPSSVRISNFGSIFQILTIVLLASTGSAVGYLVVSGRTVSTSQIVLFSVLIGSAILAIGAFWWMRRRLVSYSMIRENEPPASSFVRALRREFVRITNAWPPGLREEIIYRLYADFSEVPPDVAARLAESLILTLNLPPSDAVDFAGWARTAAQLSPSERRFLFEDLRRTVQT